MNRLKMEAILKEIEGKDENKIQEAFTTFNEKNKSNFKLGENLDTRKLFCSVLFSYLTGTSWSHDTTSLALNALKIFSRENGGAFLTSSEGLVPLVKLAGLDQNQKEIEEFFKSVKEDRPQVNVIVEAVKCLCNLVLNNHHLAGLMSDVGGLASISHRLSLYPTGIIPYNVAFFDLRLLFLITACGQGERVLLRDSFSGVLTLINVINSAIFGPNSPPMDKGVHEVCTAKKSSGECDGGDGDSAGKVGDSSAAAAGGDDGDGESTEPIKDLKTSPRKYILTTPLSDEICLLLNEALKIMFNQTVTWKKYTDDQLEQLEQLSCLLQIIMCSVCSSESKPAILTLNHCCEVIMNLPRQCCYLFLLPPEELLMPVLTDLYPYAYSTPPDMETRVDLRMYCSNIDRSFEGSNLAIAVCLLNYLNSLLVPEPEKVSRHILSIVLGAMSQLSRGNRIIRRFLKAEILPPLKEVKDRPEQGDSLKSRLVRLMTAASHDCMDVTAEFLFVLCKESASHLIKHTGYGNAAGLLMSRGLLGGIGGGESSKGQDGYSSSEDSDTEEYIRSKASLDPITGAPCEPKESILSTMTEEEIEVEAEKLGVLFDKLNQEGIFKMVPVDKDNNPVRLPNSRKDPSSS